jgi:riboflavin synthase alpha subunit
MLYNFRNKEEIVMVATEEEQKTKEQHMADYIASMKALEDAMEPFKEQKRELKANYVENGWLTKEDISLTVKAYRLLKDEVDIGALIDIYESLKGKK